MKYLAPTLLIAALAWGVFPARAQSFGTGIDAVSQPEQIQAPQPLVQGSAPLKQIPALMPAAAPVAVSRKSAPQELLKTEAPSASVLDRPTADGSQRGQVAIYEVDEYGRPQEVSRIFLYYDNFRIFRSVSGTTSCDVRFLINTTLDRRLISLDAKLVWPGITTMVSFINVDPNTPTYFNYTLLGEGCYTLDKMPNIVVNRCRVKGLSSAECAAKITWLKTTE